jgi:hypothetical protein
MVLLAGIRCRLPGQYPWSEIVGSISSQVVVGLSSAGAPTSSPSDQQAIRRIVMQESLRHLARFSPAYPALCRLASLPEAPDPRPDLSRDAPAKARNR